MRDLASVYPVATWTKRDQWITIHHGEDIDVNVPFKADRDADKLLFGVYSETGRSYLLGDAYVRCVQPHINIVPDRSVYQPGDKISLSISSDVDRIISLRGPGFEKSVESGPDTEITGFMLHEYMIKGTYYIDYRSGGLSGKIPFDVDGDFIRVVKSELGNGGRETNQPGESVDLKLWVVPKMTDSMSVTVFLESPFEEKTEITRVERSVTTGAVNALVIPIPLNTFISGTAELQYEIRSRDLLVTCGQVLAEVGPGKVVGVTMKTNRIPEYTGETQVSLALYGHGEGTLYLNVNGNEFLKESVELKGLSRAAYTVPLDGLRPGSHYVQAALYFDDCMSEKSDWFEIVHCETTPTPQKFPKETSTITGPSMVDEGNLRVDPANQPRYSPVPRETCDRLTPTPTGSPPPDILEIPSTGPWGLLILVFILGALLIRFRRTER